MMPVMWTSFWDHDKLCFRTPAVQAGHFATYNAHLPGTALAEPHSPKPSLRITVVLQKRRR